MPDRRSTRIRRHALVWSLFALSSGLALAALLAGQHARLLEDDRQNRLQRVAERTAAGLYRQLQSCGVVVRAMQSFFMGSEQVTADEFQHVYENLNPKEEFPSLVAFAYARRVEYPSTSTAPARVAYLTEMVAPSSGNESLLGLDVAGQPANLAAAERSRDSNRPAMSARFLLAQKVGGTHASDGITLRLPVYSRGAVPRSVAERRARFEGTLGVSFRVSELIRNALPSDVGEVLEVRISDLHEGVGETLYASEDFIAPAAGSDAALAQQVEFGGRTWRIELQPHAGPAPAVQWLPWLTFGIGAAASALLALLIWVLANRRERALAIARALSARYRESEARFRSLNEVLPVTVVLAAVDNGELRYVNHSGRTRLGLREDALTGHTLDALFDEPLMAAEIATAPGDLALSTTNARIRTIAGDVFWAQVSLAPLELDERPHRLAVISDVTQLRALNERLAYQASHDALTELFNRRAFEHHLERAVQALDHDGAPGALLYLDLDQFKLINDTSGHAAGDVLLAHLAARLRAELETGAVLARLGGDEFGLLLHDVLPEHAQRVAERIRILVDDFVFAWEGMTYSVTVSIGIVPLTRDGARSLSELLALADTACYMAKERGRNRVHLYSESDLETTRRRGEMEWVNRLKRALAEDRLCLYYQEIQPLQQARLGDGAHFELLIRLRDEHGELVPPGAFIPAAERYNLMPLLDRWVLQTALTNFSALHPHGARIGLCSINLSGNTLEDEEFPDYVLRELERTGVAPERICFEITETAAVGSMARVVQFIQRLRAHGCRFALDDFGVGMASFGYLKNLPIDYIKIDGSFIREIETDPMSSSIVRAVTDIGHQAGVAVVAEFVSTAQQRELLRGMGVDYAQGFFIHTPAPAGMARRQHAPV